MSTTDSTSPCECAQEEFSKSCFAYTLSVISGKYRLHILYCLMTHQIMRFNEMHRFIGGKLTFKTLSSTLKELEQEGLIIRTEYPQIPPKVEYSLSDKGQSLREVLHALCQWGQAHRS